MDTSEKRIRHDLFAGGIFIAIAALFAVQGLQYEFGSLLQMGPGFFPVVLAGVLAALGISVAISGLRNSAETVEGPVAWRAILLICLSLAIFAWGARLLGLVPVVVLCTFLSAMASRRNTVISAGIMSVVLAALCYLIFKVGLAVTLPTFGPWTGL
nr:tripartite tricarboxylate transporter TctB family protein [Rhizobium sp. Khangiran2]